MQRDDQNLKHLQRKIKIPFKNVEILKEALTHRSFINENKSVERTHNERLEFLGDAVLELVITEFLYENYTTHSEGGLTSFRAALVRTESLAEEAEKLGLGKYIYMSKEEESTGGRNRQYILANTFEALIGAIFKDRGMKKAKDFIRTFIWYKIGKIIENRLDVDAKSKLQEISQEKLKITPIYTLLDSKGPDHNKTFKMGVNIGNFTFAEGEGESKQIAEQNAARKALENWDKLEKKYFSQAK
jgi:ribonuclease-3